MQPRKLKCLKKLAIYLKLLHHFNTLVAQSGAILTRKPRVPSSIPEVFCYLQSFDVVQQCSLSHIDNLWNMFDRQPIGVLCRTSYKTSTCYQSFVRASFWWSSFTCTHIDVSETWTIFLKRPTRPAIVGSSTAISLTGGRHDIRLSLPLLKPRHSSDWLYRSYSSDRVFCCHGWMPRPFTTSMTWNDWKCM